MKSFRKIFLWSLTGFIGFSGSSWACEVCFGNPADPQNQGMQAAILTMLGVTYATLLTIIGAFAYRRYKARKAQHGGSN